MGSDRGLAVRSNFPGGTRVYAHRRGGFPSHLALWTMLLGLCLAPAARAQVSASIKGSITDPSGAPVPSATVRARNLETGAVRNTITDGEGGYLILALPVGDYEVRVAKPGFQDAIRAGPHLVIAEEASVDLRLQVSGVTSEINVVGDAPMVSATTSDISGLVGEQAVKNLPLNGRSYDLLLTLNPGIVNFTSQKTGGTGISNSSTANNFAVAGNRPQQNLFLLNGVEYTGAAENNMQPGGNERAVAGGGRGARIQRAARLLRRRIRQATRRPGDHCDAIRQ